jgi:hypothetical protein
MAPMTIAMVDVLGPVGRFVERGHSRLLISTMVTMEGWLIRAALLEDYDASFAGS